MKLQIQRGKKGQTWTLDIPQAVCASLPVPGELFTVGVSRDGKTYSPVSACWIGDGRSLLVGTEVVRVGELRGGAKKDAFRLGLGAPGAVLTRKSVLAKVLRPVEPKRSAESLGGGDVKAPMTGKVLSVLVSEGGAVREGDTLLVIEAMKMENRLLADCTGTVRNLKAAAGRSVSTGELLLTLEPGTGGEG